LSGTYREEHELGAFGGRGLDGRTRVRDVASLVRRHRELAQRHLELHSQKRTHGEVRSHPDLAQKSKPKEESDAGSRCHHLGERRCWELEGGRGARHLRAEGGGGGGHGGDPAERGAGEEEAGADGGARQARGEERGGSGCGCGSHLMGSGEV
jgi:hypothetical protein